MDLTSLDRIRTPRTRADLVLGPGSAPLAGGTWLFSEPQPHLSELVDLTGLGWPPFEVGDGLTIAATCTLRQLADLPAVPGWRSQHLVRQCLRVARDVGEDLGPARRSAGTSASRCPPAR